MEPVRCADCQSRQRRVDHLRAENDRLRHQLDAALRAGKRQAGPFARGQPKANPRRPGRKPRQDYGPKAHRQPPSPEQIDEVHEAPLPHACPDCGGPLDETHIAQQFQVEIPPKPIHRQFNIRDTPAALALPPWNYRAFSLASPGRARENARRGHGVARGLGAGHGPGRHVRRKRPRGGPVYLARPCWPDTLVGLTTSLSGRYACPRGRGPGRRARSSGKDRLLKFSPGPGLRRRSSFLLARQ